jgi:hypothetical protein
MLWIPGWKLCIIFFYPGRDSWENWQTIQLGTIADSTKDKIFSEKKKKTKVHNIEGGYKDGRKNYQNKDT